LDLAGFTGVLSREDCLNLSFRGSKSRNKVSVGEPAEGSLSQFEMSKSVCLCFSQSEPPFAWQTCIENTTLYSGSLGSGVDEERS
jgi:hypothetical protein